tara:strand:- start:985 stop:1368 length:384 start_codon:yes stop_codon:yes gene_type:complete
MDTIKSIENPITRDIKIDVIVPLSYKPRKSLTCYCCSSREYSNYNKKIVKLLRYILIFFICSFLGKLYLKIIYWTTNDCDNWFCKNNTEYVKGWNWGDINVQIFIQAFFGCSISAMLYGCCCCKGKF